MSRSRSNEELADLLLAPQVDATTLNEAARRLRDMDLQHLLTVNEVIEAVNDAPTITRDASRQVETIVTSITLSKRSSPQMSSLAARIMAGEPYEDHHVKSLAASVLAQDEVRGQD